MRKPNNCISWHDRQDNNEQTNFTVTKNNKKNIECTNQKYIWLPQKENTFD